MRSRREIIVTLGAIGIAPIALAARGGVLTEPSGNRGLRIRGIERRDETTLRLGGIGDGFDMAWDTGDHQFVVVNDGTGWEEKPTGFYNTRLWSLSGDARHAMFDAVNGYPELNNFARSEAAPHYYGRGILSVKGRLYQFLSTLDRAQDTPRHWVGAKLIYSVDGGHTWRNQDGSFPVTWEDWERQSRDRLIFFREPLESFSLISILQMGRDYSANRDGYVYGYSPNGNVDGRMNELVMFRVPIDRVLTRAAYEFFGGSLGGGRARWVRDIQARAVVHTFPRGWVNRTNLFSGDLVVESWLPSVVYNERLGVYLMAASGDGCAADGTELGKPSYLGFWISTTPWGPWRQIHEETAWTPNDDPAARAYCPKIVPGWIAADGQSLWLVWADLQGMRAFTRDRAVLAASLDKAKTPQARSAVLADFHRSHLPYYAFNTQRVDLIVSD